MKQIDRERKLTQRFLKCHLSRLVNNPGQEQIDPELLCGPISAIPRAFTDSNGLPTQSYTRSFALLDVHISKPMSPALGIIHLKLCFIPFKELSHH